MNLTLKDLAVVERDKGLGFITANRPASLADLVEVLKAEGATIEEAFVSEGFIT